MSVRTRFAPSPTGFMHVGGIRTALFAWLHARHNKGQFILRIEDTDKVREVAGSIEHLIDSLKWLGISWDEGPDIGGPHASYKQSERLPLYKTYAEKLVAAGHAYPDPYTEEEVEAFRQKAQEEKRPFLYREHRPTAEGVWDGSQPLRFKVPTIKRFEWHDAVFGDLSAGEEALDDFILIKSDGYPTYNFAHIVDDIEMQITHVMRGQEFISSTPKFLSLYESLGVIPPIFATLPPILGESGTKKLSKRDGAKDVFEYRDEGYLPDAMINFLAFLGWNPGGDKEHFTREELIATFDIERIQKSGAMFDDEKLLFMNREWMRELKDDEYISRGAFGSLNSTILKKTIPLLKERVHTFKEARDMLSGELSCLFTTPKIDTKRLIAKELQDHAGMTKQVLEAVLGLIEGLPSEVSMDTVKDTVMPYADAEEAKGKGGRGAVLWPLRFSLSGEDRSPDPFTLISILGPKESALRIQNALAALG